MSNPVTPEPEDTPSTSVTPDPAVAEIPTATPVLEDAPEKDLDPLEAIVDFEAEDPEPEIVEDPEDQNFCAPAEGIAPRKKV